MNISYVKELLERRKLSFINHDKAFGTAIKLKRLENHWTLEEAATNICSVSYLSKVENSQIIPSDAKRLMLQEKFQIEEIHMHQYQFDNIVNQWIAYCLYEQQHVKEALLNVTINKNHFGLFQQFLIGHLINNKDILMSNLYIYFDKFDETALFLIFYAYALTTYKKGLVQQAYDALTLININDLPSDDARIVYHLLLIKCCYKCHKVTTFFNIYDQLKEQVLKTDAFFILKELQKMRRSLLAIYNAYPNNLKNQSYFMNDVAYFKVNPSFPLQESQVDSSFLASLHITKNDTIKKHLIDFKNKDHPVYQFLMKIYHASDTDILKFLRDHLEHVSLSSYDYLTVHFLTHQASFYFEQNHFYKEAAKTLRKGFRIQQTLIKA